MGEFSPWHWAIVILAFVVLFGYRKLPDAARGIGQSLRIIKAELKSAQDQPVLPASSPVFPVSHPAPPHSNG